MSQLDPIPQVIMPEQVCAIDTVIEFEVPANCRFEIGGTTRYGINGIVIPDLSGAPIGNIYLGVNGIDLWSMPIGAFIQPITGPIYAPIIAYAGAFIRLHADGNFFTYNIQVAANVFWDDLTD